MDSISDMLDKLDINAIEDIACGLRTTNTQEQRLVEALKNLIDTVDSIQAEQRRA